MNDPIDGLHGPSEGRRSRVRQLVPRPDRLEAMRLPRRALSIGSLMLALLLAASPAAAAPPCSGDPEVSVGDAGLEPSSVCILPGASIHWTNDASGTQDVVEPLGLWNSGHLAPGAGFSITLGEPGTYLYRSTFSTVHAGEIVVAMEGLEGPADGLARDAIPGVSFPAQLEDDLSPHPIWGYLTSRTRLMVGFGEEATVSQANAALADAGVVVLGGLPKVGVILVAAEDTEDFSAVFFALDSLDAAEGVKAVSLAPLLTTTALPRPADSATMALLDAAGEASEWRWNVQRTEADGPSGVGGNWNLEASRIPQAWNWREAIVRQESIELVRTAVVDTGFMGPHVDLAKTRKITTVCAEIHSGETCTLNNVDFHGHLTTSIIAAEYDNDSSEADRSLGVSGVNPYARVDAISWNFERSVGGSWPTYYQVVNAALDDVPNLRVINASLKVPSSKAVVPTWWTDEKKGLNDDCGPGPNDDGVPGQGVCTFNNHDGWLKDIRHFGGIAHFLAERIASAGVVMVHAAGNDSDVLCIDKSQTEHCLGYVTSTENASGFGWAGANWNHPSLFNPIVNVEAIESFIGNAKIEVRRAAFSNINGDISAPANGFVRPVDSDSYEIMISGGTSSAAPHVSGVVGQLLAWNPELSAEKVINQLLLWSRDDVFENEAWPGAPRIDAFASMLSLEGAVFALVDVNDESMDGNQRIFRGPGTPTEPAGAEVGVDLYSSDETEEGTNRRFRTAPDGRIDMRDFRRFRDARSQICLERGLEKCPDLASGVFLDGAPDHPKKDLNFDGCVHSESNADTCPYEWYYSRFDFNGDGVISATSRWPVPLRPDGTLAVNPSEATEMTDLEVLASQWEPDPEDTEGYTAEDLPALLNSSDIIVRADQLFENGALEVEVAFQDVDTGEMLPTRYMASDESIVYTVPVGPTWELIATADVGGEIQDAERHRVTFSSAGNDIRFDLCTRKLELAVSPPVILADNLSEASITASLQTCGTDTLENLDPTITFSVTPDGGAHGHLLSPDAPFDDSFRATNTFVAGSTLAQYIITAVVSIPRSGGGVHLLEKSVTVRTRAAQKVFYRWMQSTFEFEEQGSTRWPGGPAASDGIDIACVDVSVSGTVFDPDASDPTTPLEGASVELLGSAETPVTTDADGAFAFTSIALSGGQPANVIVRATAGAFSAEWPATLFCGAQLVIELGGDPPLGFGSVEGTVSDFTTGNPIPNAFVGTDYGASALTNDSGTYKIEEIPLGASGEARTVTLSAVVPGYPRERAEVIVSSGPASNVDLRLSVGDCDGQFFDYWEQGGQSYFRELRDGQVYRGDLPSGGEPRLLQSYGFNRCVEHFSQSAGSDADPEILTREGILAGAGGAVQLTESPSFEPVESSYVWRTTFAHEPSSMSYVDDIDGDLTTRIADFDLDRYTDHPLPTVRMESTADGLRIEGIEAIAELEYRYQSTWTDTGIIYGTPIGGPVSTSYIDNTGVAWGVTAYTAATMQPELLIVPRRDGSSFKISGSPGQPILFPGDANNGFEKYEYCEFIEREYDTEPEYFSTFDVVKGATFDYGTWRRNSTFQAIDFSTFPTGGSFRHEYPMPVGGGLSRVRYAFVAIPYTDDAEVQALLDAGELDFPTCLPDDGLTAHFLVNPNPADEGSVVDFVDDSSSPGNSIVAWQWDFGDGATSEEPHPSHRYEDDGEFDVTLTVIDATGAIGSTSIPLVVENRPPLAEVDDALATEGQDGQLIVRVGDPGDADRLGLRMQLTSSVAAFQPIDQIVPAGIYPFLVVNLAAGTYPITLTVTDKDGGVATDTAELRILAVGEPPPPPPPPLPPTPTCDPTVSLDGQEQTFLNLLNALRADAGADPLVASPGLTRAAARHSIDMASLGFLSHIGSDGSDPGQRAEEAGYWSTDVEENVLSGADKASNVLFGWMSSSDHAANLLNPDFASVGIARVQGADWYWTADFGEEIDCPIVGGSLLPETSQQLASRSAAPARPFASAPDLSDDVRVMSFGSGAGAHSALGATATLVSTGMGFFRAVSPIVAPPASPGPIAALAVSRLSAEVGQGVVLRNRSRDDLSAPIGATIDPGDGSQPQALGPNGSFQHHYTLAGTYQVSLSATDAKGATTSVARSVEIHGVGPPPDPDPTLDPDFLLSLSPSSHVMAPGTSVNFVVSVSPIDGFAAPLTLTAGALPTGVTASFAQTVLTPPGSTLLTIAAATGATVGDFEVQVTAEGGGLSHATMSEFRLDFGLVPICTGTFAGRVTDAETGEPLVGAIVSRSNPPSTFDGVEVDEEGFYTYPGIPLGTNNAPISSGLWSSATGYFRISAGAVVSCGAVTELNFQMFRARTSAVSGRVVVGIPDPNDTSLNRAVTPTNAPIADATARVTFYDDVTGDADGYYLFDGLFLSSGNQPRTYDLTILATDYWPSDRRDVVISDGETTVENFALVPICYANVTVTIRYADGEPAAGMGVNFSNGGFNQGFLTDANGRFYPELERLGHNNSATTYYVTSPEVPFRHALDARIFASECDQQIDAQLIVRRLQERRGDFAGFVTDRETGAPIPGVQIQLSGGLDNRIVTSDGSGAYLFENFLVGHDEVSSSPATLRAAQTDAYFGDSYGVTVYAESTTQGDLQLLRKKVGALLVTVRDLETRAPIEGAWVRAAGAFSLLADANGEIFVDGLALLPENGPRSYSVQVSNDGYWPRSRSVTVHGDETAELDVDLIPVCEGATIVGSVTNAATGEPLGGVSIVVRPLGNPFPIGVQTGADGNYIVEDVTVGTDNSPISAQITASKTGFVTQSRSVTLFCGARITLAFGEPPGELGAIEGTVTDSDGAPLAGVFIGSGFGAATSTDAQGYYQLGDVPLGPNDADREWEITADPDDRDAQTHPVVAVAGQTVRLDFVFGENTAPVADAGPDQNASTGVAVMLDGSDSFDPDGDMIGFDWSLERGSKPAASQLLDADLSGRTTPMPGFTPDVDGVYVIELIVDDGDLQSPPDSVQIDASSPNVPPNADAGEDQNAFLGATIQLDASASDDPDYGPQPLGFEWRFFALPVASALSNEDIGGAGTALAEFTPDVAGSYVVDVEVDDGADSDVDAVEIVVQVPNVPPNADAGDDTERVVGDLVILDGSGSNDPDQGPNLLAFAWRFVTIPEGSALTNSDIAFETTAAPRFTPDVPGVYVLELAVDDGEDVDFDNTMVEVAPPNLPPEADAGDDRSAPLGDPIALDGSGSIDPDSGPEPLSFRWRLLSVPQGSALVDADIAGADTAFAEILPDLAGVYRLELLVSDGQADDSDEALAEAVAEAEPPAPVSDLVARPKLDKIDLVWTPIPGAVSYDIYRSESAGGPYEAIALGHVSTYAAYADFGVSTNVTYFYVVVSVDVAGLVSEASNEASATPTNRQPR